MMNAVTKVITAMRMQHVLIALDTLNAYVTQGLLEMGVSVQVKLPFFSFFMLLLFLVLLCLLLRFVLFQEGD